mmetsp:Transcript_48991/g.94682  ORF Transcript_48991/g.94682 Transcript_48991/m.94682 type:complete len:113 (-) Transcript_48991:369-707(-)|eukprot:CAMPEP_0172668908 /NCGR_PEP_ID=MMETSP1074-20121228/9353_1 /TAXON_ID=2916 /ORGANISM="Ceratium fusus, Strain PA161109" /LENGTH=112 /DNA_ID=CAMNT_0013485619 /DNA_START=17 /DNA_END=355 /DNA_ORIENTATION=-
MATEQRLGELLTEMGQMSQRLQRIIDLQTQTLQWEEQKPVRLGNKAALLKLAKHNGNFLRSVQSTVKIAGYCTLAITFGCCVLCVIYTLSAFKDSGEDYQILGEASSSSSHM